MVGTDGFSYYFQQWCRGSRKGAAFARGFDEASYTVYNTAKDATITCGADAANPAAECVGLAATGYSCGSTSFMKNATELLDAESKFTNICQLTEKCGADDASFPAALIPESKVFL